MFGWICFPDSFASLLTPNAIFEMPSKWPHFKKWKCSLWITHSVNKWFPGNVLILWMTTIFKNVHSHWMPTFHAQIQIGVRFCTKIVSLTKLAFFSKNEGFTIKKTPFFIVLTKWPLFFLSSLLKDPLFSLFCLSLKAYFWDLVLTVPVTSISMSAPRHELIMMLK